MICRKKTSRVFVIVVFLVCFTALSEAQGRRNLPQYWSEELGRIHNLLMAHDWKKAEKQSRKLSDEMVDLIISGERGRDFLGTVSGFRAIALNALGLDREAHWYWNVAVQLCPTVGELDPKEYFPGSFLGTDWTPDALINPWHVDDDEGKELYEAGRVTPPEKLKWKKPRYPRAQITFISTVKVGATVGKDGLPYEPEIIEMNGDYTLAFAALEAMMNWEFSPAKIDNLNVPAFYGFQFKFTPQ